MPPPSQRIRSLSIKRLKGLNNLFIDFEGKPLTAIMGVNGCGKTTILHALACAFKPYSGNASRNYVFSEFFTPNTDSRWAGSEFTLFYDHDLANPRFPHERTYKKGGDRWGPRYSTRLPRWVSYVGILESVPLIEQIKNRSHISLSRVNRPDPQSERVKLAAGHILNKQYTQFTANSFGNKVFVGVEHRGQHYSALSMGSGEQRVFRILEEAYRAPEYGLLLIDEIELLMHGKALRKLIEKLYEIARDKHLQIVFTTHSEAINELKDFVNIRHVFIAEDGNAYCLNDTNPNLLYELTGHQERPISLFVEDELSREIVLRVASDLGIRKYVQTDVFGPAINCFTTAAGAILNGINTENSLFILDGDLYATADQKKERMNAVLTGTDMASRRKKVQALQCIRQFNLPTGIKPEKYLHSQIISTTSGSLTHEFEEIRHAAVHIQETDDAHKFIDDVIARLGHRKDEYGDVVRFLSTLPFWEGYIQPVKDWLNEKIAALNL